MSTWKSLTIAFSIAAPISLIFYQILLRYPIPDECNNVKTRTEDSMETPEQCTGKDAWECERKDR